MTTYRVTAEHNGKTTWYFSSDKKDAEGKATSNGGTVEIKVNGEWVAIDRWENEGGK